MEATTKPPLSGPTRPLGAPDIPQFHLRPMPGASGIYSPWLYGAAHVHFVDRRRKIDETRHVAFRLPLIGTMRTIDWDAAVPAGPPADVLVTPAPVPASYRPLPPGAMELKTFTRWAKSFDRWLARTQRMPVAAADGGEPSALGPKRGGVSVELVAIVWELA